MLFDHQLPSVPGLPVPSRPAVELKVNNPARSRQRRLPAALPRSLELEFNWIGIQRGDGRN